LKYYGDGSGGCTKHIKNQENRPRGRGRVVVNMFIYFNIRYNGKLCSLFLILYWLGWSLMNVENVNISYSLSFDLDLDMVNGIGRINVFFDEDYEEETCIGIIAFNYYNVYELGSNANLLVSADAVSGDELYMVETLLENDFEFEFGGKLITLDRIEIEETYYTEELEKLVMKEFLKYCSYMTFDYILVIACRPMKNNKKAQDIIEFPQLKLYLEFNFKYIGGSENKAPVMLKNINLNN
jgi:hypothetical protein